MNSENYLESRDPLVVEDVMRPPDVKLDQEWCVGGVKLFIAGAGKDTSIKLVRQQVEERKAAPTLSGLSRNSFACRNLGRETKNCHPVRLEAHEYFQG